LAEEGGLFCVSVGGEVPFWEGIIPQQVLKDFLGSLGMWELGMSWEDGWAWREKQ
jgi:hypothetical protein